MIGVGLIFMALCGWAVYLDPLLDMIFKSEDKKEPR